MQVRLNYGLNFVIKNYSSNCSSYNAKSVVYDNRKDHCRLRVMVFLINAYCCHSHEKGFLNGHWRY